MKLLRLSHFRRFGAYWYRVVSKKDDIGWHWLNWNVSPREMSGAFGHIYTAIDKEQFYNDEEYKEKTMGIDVVVWWSGMFSQRLLLVSNNWTWIATVETRIMAIWTMKFVFGLLFHESAVIRTIRNVYLIKLIVKISRLRLSHGGLAMPRSRLSNISVLSVLANVSWRVNNTARHQKTLVRT